MDTKENIAEMFLKDYQSIWDGQGETWSQVQILSDFLMWKDQRKTGCKLIDLLVKDPMAQNEVDQQHERLSLFLLEFLYMNTVAAHRL